MYSKTTDQITVTVVPAYLDAESAPEKNHYVWAYKVTITNNSAEAVQVISRYWHITDAFGRSQEVRGDGVVGEQPVIPPGKAFTYTSGTHLPTPSGIMFGTYHITSDSGINNDIDIPVFSLDIPSLARQLN